MGFFKNVGSWVKKAAKTVDEEVVEPAKKAVKRVYGDTVDIIKTGQKGVFKSFDNTVNKASSTLSAAVWPLAIGGVALGGLYFYMNSNKRQRIEQ